MLKFFAYISFTVIASIAAMMTFTDPDSITLTSIARLFQINGYWIAVIFVSIILWYLNQLFTNLGVLAQALINFVDDRWLSKAETHPANKVQVGDTP